MAARGARPGRTLIAFFVVLAISYGLVAIGGSWKPELGLDLQGGTRITLIAKDSPTPESLTEAADIIDQRVNGSGVSEAEVTTQGNRFVVVEIPGKSRRDLVDTVKRQAQLRFRLVACSTLRPCGDSSISPGESPGGVTVPGVQNSPSPKSRAPFSTVHKNAEPSSEPGAEPSDAPSQAPAESPFGDPLTWMNNPSPAWVKAFNAFSCPSDGSLPLVDDNADKPLITCDDQGVKYLLTTAMIEGTELKRAEAVVPDQQVSWVVSLAFDRAGTKKFTEISRALFGTQDQFAVVLDGQVLSAPTMNGLITNGEAQISGEFTEASASSLATSLKFGALPIAFEKDPPVETVGPSLAGDQLRAGITAGLAGLILVMIYCLFYYRGLGVVVIVSLIVAAALTYSMVLLLSATAGFTLSLPGIAGLIVAVGITADSFIVFFERIRDEMRDGKSMRVAVESGWIRARNTCLAADTVSLLAATVLYIFAAGVVKGFAFALGLSTIIDLAVFFWFTHPMVSWLARFSFFNKGHKYSGLDAGNLGTDRVPVGGTA
ncbi:protein translocase subunit SecD [Nocardioides sp.]|uniref:protein translocase subunit SecD n=1 Tax=Nocardioides sp. TaxID=35761 RepID=UPI00356479DB